MTWKVNGDRCLGKRMKETVLGSGLKSKMTVKMGKVKKKPTVKEFEAE